MDKLDQIIAEARRSRELRNKGYRERALKILPWVCGRCGREFTRENVRMLTVHHKDHNHDYNPPDGSNWELLCLYCHDIEHSRYLEEAEPDETAPEREQKPSTTHKPFAGLEALLKVKK